MTEDLKLKITKMIELMGFRDFRVDWDASLGRVSVAIYDELVKKETLPEFVLNVNRVVRLIAKKMRQRPVVIDVNNYRREREGLIIKLARAAARRAATTGEPVALPAMNSYERRLVHTELAMRPDVKTESVGTTKRYVVVRPI
jgi:hypothetical protein